jgi:hypothetical protein
MEGHKCKGLHKLGKRAEVGVSRTGLDGVAIAVLASDVIERRVCRVLTSSDPC